MNITEARKKAQQQLSYGHYSDHTGPYRFMVFCPVCRVKIRSVEKSNLRTKLTEHLQDEH